MRLSCVKGSWFSKVSSATFSRGNFLLETLSNFLFLALQGFCLDSLLDPHMLSCFSRVQLFVTLWTVVCQAPLCMGFSRQEYEVGCQALLQGIFPTQWLNPCLLHLLQWQAGSLPLAPPGKPSLLWRTTCIRYFQVSPLSKYLHSPFLSTLILSVGWRNIRLMYQTAKNL